MMNCRGYLVVHRRESQIPALLPNAQKECRDIHKNNCSGTLTVLTETLVRNAQGVLLLTSNYFAIF